MTPTSSSTTHFSPYPRPLSRPTSRPTSPVPPQQSQPAMVNLHRRSSAPSSSTSLFRPLAQLQTSPLAMNEQQPKHAPYMVALSGWPEPVYVAERGVTTGTRRSRANSPEFSSLPLSSPNTNVNGITLPNSNLPLPASIPSNQSATTTRNPPVPPSLSGSIDTGATFAVPAIPKRDPLSPSASARPSSPAPNSISPRPTAPEKSIFNNECPYLLPAGFSLKPSSTSDQLVGNQDKAPKCICADPSRHGPSSSSSSITSNIGGIMAPPATSFRNKDPSLGFPTSSARGGDMSKQKAKSSFVDPRYGPNAGVLSNHKIRFLPVVPTWTDSSPSSSRSSTLKSSQAANGVKLENEREGLRWTQKAVADVYPPVEVSSPSIITQVYPRDPNTVFLWGSGAVSPQSKEEDETDVKIEKEERMEVDQ